MAFAYVGQAFTPDEFRAYVATYDFGSVPPDYIVLHHTAIPATSWAPSGAPAAFWDAGEAGMRAAQVKAKRLATMNGVKNYYQNTLGWDAGPHLWIDDQYIYAMTPMYDVGIHAMWGNSFTTRGRLHYSIGIEVVGCYTNVQWPPAVQANVRAAVQTLQQRLGTFSLDYMYADPASKPGRAIDSKGNYYCPHPERLRFGGISSHRDYNKPECPGNAITEDFYMSVLRGPAAPQPSVTDDLYLGTGPRIRLDTFQAVLHDHGSPIPADHAADTYALLVKREINAARWLAHTSVESDFGTAAQAMATANVLNLRARPGDPAINGFWNYNGAWYLGNEASIIHLKHLYGQYNKLTWRDIGSLWARETPTWDAAPYLAKCDAVYTDILKREQ